MAQKKVVEIPAQKSVHVLTNEGDSLTPFEESLKWIAGSFETLNAKNLCFKRGLKWNNQPKDWKQGGETAKFYAQHLLNNLVNDQEKRDILIRGLKEWGLVPTTSEPRERKSWDDLLAEEKESDNVPF